MQDCLPLKVINLYLQPSVSRSHAHSLSTHQCCLEWICCNSVWFTALLAAKKIQKIPNTFAWVDFKALDSFTLRLSLQTLPVQNKVNTQHLFTLLFFLEKQIPVGTLQLNICAVIFIHSYAHCVSIWKLRKYLQRYFSYEMSVNQERAAFL